MKRFDLNSAVQPVVRAAAAASLLALIISAAQAQVASNPLPSYAPNSLATVVKKGVLQWNLWGPGLANGPGLNADDNNNFADLSPIVQGSGVAVYGQPATIFTNILQGPRSDTNAVLGDGYCDQFVGVFIPPATTNYTFFLCSDDYSQLYLSSDIGASDARLIAQEDSWSNPNQWTTSDGGSTLASKRSDQFIPPGATAPAYPNGIPMVAGQMYFIELVHENGVGGYNDSATYKFAGAPDPANGASTVIGPNNLGFVAQPPTYVDVVITPSNETVYADSEASFSASVFSDATPYPPSFQWQKNGANITNADGTVADGPLYTTIVTTNDNGDAFQCVVTFPGVTNSYASAPSRIAVLPGTIVNGGLKREYWANTGSLSGLMAGDLSTPTYTAALTNFECPVNTGLSNYDQRVSGWFIPSTTGKYVFFVESDDTGDLFLSTDSTKDNMRLICQETEWADSLEWMTDEGGGVTSGAAITQKRSDQWSPDGGLTVPYAGGIPLVAGVPYYLEGDMAQGGGGDNFAATFKLTTQADPTNGQAPALVGADISSAASPPAPPGPWNATAQWSATSNPNGAWSYGQRSLVIGNGFDLMASHCDCGGGPFWLSCPTCFWPSIQGSASGGWGPLLWPYDNSSGYPVVRWTCPTAGTYALESSFDGADSRGVNVLVWVVTNGSLAFSGSVQAYQGAAGYSTTLQLQAGAYVDFIVGWNGGTSAVYNWTAVNATISAVPAPTITQQPVSVITNQGASVTFAVGATGSPPLSYQWLFGNTALAGKTASSLILPSTAVTNIGYYSVLVTNAGGVVFSSSASLTFFDPKMYAGITLTGPAGGSYAIQALPSVGATNWTTLTNVTLGTQSYFYIDSRAATNGTRFYRAISPP